MLHADDPLPDEDSGLLIKEVRGQRLKHLSGHKTENKSSCTGECGFWVSGGLRRLSVTSACLCFSSRDVDLCADQRLRGRSVLYPVPKWEAVSEGPGGGRGLSAARSHQTEEEPGTLRLRQGAVLHRCQPDGVRQKQGPRVVSA